MQRAHFWFRQSPGAYSEADIERARARSGARASRNARPSSTPATPASSTTPETTIKRAKRAKRGGSK